MPRGFPADFRFGAATSAYQIEGAHEADGKGRNWWDDWADEPGRIQHAPTVHTTCDHYRLFADDVARMRDLNLNAYRFSVNWSRVLPNGRGQINPAGLDFYSRLVDELLAADVAPMITLYHWDLPSALQRDVNGWLSDEIVDVFADYAEFMFRRLGDRVSTWMTFNEPWVSVIAGYLDGVHPPGVKDRRLCYQAAHQIIRSHGAAAERFRNALPDAELGIAINTTYAYPASNRAADRAAAERAMLDFAGWFTDPVVFGDYPAEVRAAYGDLLPALSDVDQRRLKTSTDYIGVNYYFSDVVAHADDDGPLRLKRDKPVDRIVTVTDWPVVPEGLKDLLLWFHERYGKPLAVTENGAAFDDQPDENEFVQDDDRIAYLRDHLAACAAAMEAGVDLRGYYAWSLLDNLEWNSGFSRRFGLMRTNFETQQRTMKASGRWYADFIQS